ncbi:MAG: GNAT family N-acetyltransferase [bacterium]|nr:GNAT family N-acetyltransferase [bacterium]
MPRSDPAGPGEPRPVIREAGFADVEALAHLYREELSLHERLDERVVVRPGFDWVRYVSNTVASVDHFLLVSEVAGPEGSRIVGLLAGTLKGLPAAGRPGPGPAERVRRKIRGVLARLARLTRRGATGGIFVPIRRGFIQHCYVVEEMRGQGIATALARRALDLLAELGAERVDLQVMTRNDAALEFWKSLDFESLKVEMTRKLSERHARAIEHPDLEEIFLEVRESFPELGSRLVPKRKRALMWSDPITGRIHYDPQRVRALGFSEGALRGMMAHELAHQIDYRRRGLLARLLSTRRYFGKSRRYRIECERAADEIAVTRGYGRELAQLFKELREKLDPRVYAKYVAQLHLSVEEIEQRIAAAGPAAGGPLGSDR